MIVCAQQGDIFVDATHLIQRNGFLIECRDCHVCTCHGKAILALKCEKTHVEVNADAPHSGNSLSQLG